MKEQIVIISAEVGFISKFTSDNEYPVIVRMSNYYNGRTTIAKSTKTTATALAQLSIGLTIEQFKNLRNNHTNKEIQFMALLTKPLQFRRMK